MADDQLNKHLADQLSAAHVKIGEQQDEINRLNRVYESSPSIRGELELQKSRAESALTGQRAAENNAEAAQRKLRESESERLRLEEQLEEVSTERDRLRDELEHFRSISDRVLEAKGLKELFE